MNQRSRSAARRTVGGGPSTAAAAVAVAFVVALLLVAETAAAPSSSSLLEDPVSLAGLLATPRRLHKRSFFELQCKGVYDKSLFAKLDRICEDCYNLFREPSIHSLCRKNCFTTNYFKGCVDTLQLSDETEQIKEMIKQLHGADPGV